MKLVSPGAADTDACSTGQELSVPDKFDIILESERAGIDGDVDFEQFLFAIFSVVMPESDQKPESAKQLTPQEIVEGTAQLLKKISALRDQYISLLRESGFFTAAHMILVQISVLCASVLGDLRIVSCTVPSIIALQHLYLPRLQRGQSGKEALQAMGRDFIEEMRPHLRQCLAANPELRQAAEEGGFPYQDL